MQLQVPKKKTAALTPETVRRKVSSVDQMAQYYSYYNVKSFGSTEEDSAVLLEEMQRRRSIVDTFLMPVMVPGGLNENTAHNISNRVRRNVTADTIESQFIPEYKLEDTVLPKWMVLHCGRLRLVWNWIILAIVAYQAIIIPFTVSFELHYNVKLYIADIILELVFVFDIILNFRTTFINQRSGRLVTSPREITVHYLKTWFVVDLIATFPFDLIYFIRTDWSATINMLKLKRLLRLVRFGRRVLKYLEYTSTLLLLLMFSFALLSHWLSCVWYVIGYKEEQGGEEMGWLHRLGKRINRSTTNNSSSTPSYSEAYISSLYFIFTSLTTVGFGNISPNTVAEKTFSIIVLMLGAIVQSAIFGNMTAVIQKLYASRARFHSKASQIKQFVMVHHIDGELKKRIEDWFISHWSISKGVNTDEMLESFPTELQADICLHLYQEFLTLPCFLNSSRGCLRSISVKVKKAYYSPGQLIIKEKDAINSLFFVQKGTVEIVQREYIVVILGAGDLFGENIFKPHSTNSSNGDVKALMYCEVLYLSRDEIQGVLRSYPDFPKQFSRFLALSFDLSKIQIPLRNGNNHGLGSIMEEDKESLPPVQKDSSASEMSTSDDEVGSTDFNANKDIIKKRSTRKNTTSMPLWQLQLTNPRNSPTPSLKSRLKILENSNTSSINGDDLSEDVDMQRSTSQIYRSDQEPINGTIDAETCFMGNSLSSFGKNKDNLSREELYEESVLENDGAEMSHKRSVTSSKSSRRELLGYFNHGADLTRNDMSELCGIEHTPLKRLSSSSLPENINNSPITRKSPSRSRNTFSTGMKRRQSYDVSNYNCNRRQSYDIKNRYKNTVIESESTNNQSIENHSKANTEEAVVYQPLSPPLSHRRHSNNPTASLISILEDCVDDQTEYEKPLTVSDCNDAEIDIEHIYHQSIDLEASKSFSEYESYERPSEEYIEPSPVDPINDCYYDDKEENTRTVLESHCDGEQNTDHLHNWSVDRNCSNHDNRSENNSLTDDDKYDVRQNTPSNSTDGMQRSSVYADTNFNKMNRDMNTLRNEIVDLKYEMSALTELVRMTLSRSSGIDSPSAVNR